MAMPFSLPLLLVAVFTGAQFPRPLSGEVSDLHLRPDPSSGGGGPAFALAAARTYRRDPTDGFGRYPGGWNISDSHYWASVGFTAAPFFVIAAVWFVIFGLTLCCSCMYFCCCRKPPYGYSRTCYAFSLMLLLFFTLAAIVGCIFLYTGQARFHTSTGTTMNYVVGQADATAENLTYVSSYLESSKTLGVDQLMVPDFVVAKITKIQSKVDSASDTLTTKTHDNSRKIERDLNTVRVVLMVVAAVMLLLAFVGSLLSVFGVQCLVYTLVFVGWFLVTATFILCGIFLVLHNVVADTCVAMDEWVENPTAHTALDDILPCVDNRTAQDILQQSKEINRQVINLVDAALANISNGNFRSDSGIFYYNQSGPLVPLLCNPYNADLTDHACSQGGVDYDNAVEVWKNYICQVSDDNRTCKTTGRLNPTHYGQLINVANVSYGLYTYTPFLVNLVDCTFVRSTFSEISNVYCPGLHKYTKWIYMGLVLVSAAVMLSLVFWVIYARERRHRVYTKLVAGANGAN